MMNLDSIHSSITNRVFNEIGVNTGSQQDKSITGFRFEQFEHLFHLFFVLTQLDDFSVGVCDPLFMVGHVDNIV